MQNKAVLETTIQMMDAQRPEGFDMSEGAWEGQSRGIG